MGQIDLQPALHMPEPLSITLITRMSVRTREEGWEDTHERSYLVLHVVVLVRVVKEKEEKSGEERCGYMWTIYNVSNAEAVRAQRNGMSDGECGNEGEGEGQRVYARRGRRDWRMD